jgi:hypothetical protein
LETSPITQLRQKVLIKKVEEIIYLTARAKAVMGLRCLGWAVMFTTSDDIDCVVVNSALYCDVCDESEMRPRGDE